MLIERCAYSNRWRRVSPAAKGLFSCSGMIASFLATTPGASCAIAVVIASITIVGAGIRFGDYLRVFLPPLFFLAISCVTLVVSFDGSASPLHLAANLEHAQLPDVALICGRSVNALTALLFLSLTTPMTDLIALLRRLRVPEILLDIMTLSYRTLFVFMEAVHDTWTAQSARLGYATYRQSLTSLGCLVANMTIQVWQRANALQVAALARNNDGPLYFLENEYRDGGSATVLASVAGCILLVVSLVSS